MHLRETARFAGEAFGWYEGAAFHRIDGEAQRMALRRVWLYGSACLALFISLAVNGFAG